MKARLRIIVAASVGLLLAGTPGLAQETAAPPQDAIVGPPQLQNFSLNGTVTREAPAPTEVAPAPREEPRRQPPAQAAEPQRQERPAAAPSRAVADEQPQPQPRPQRESVAEADSPLLPQLDPEPTREVTDATEPDFDTSAAAAVGDSPGSISILPWLLAALVLGGAAAWFFLRQRPRESYAGVGSVDAFDARPEARPEPRQQPPAPVPAATPAPPGIVSTRLRPWLDIEFEPLRAVVDDQKAAVAFRLSVLNSATVAARDILLEASLFNAGPMQDQQIQLFFDNPVAKGDRLQSIPPMERMTVETAVFLQRDQVRPIEIEGRTFFVPMIAFNVLYSWGRGEGQTSASFLVGKQTSGEKLAPFRLDLGSRVFRNLAAREHELRVRK